MYCTYSTPAASVTSPESYSIFAARVWKVKKVFEVKSQRRDSSTQCPEPLISIPATFNQTHLAAQQAYFQFGLPIILSVTILHNLRRAYRLRIPNLSHSRLVVFQNDGTRDGGARGKTGECDLHISHTVDAVQAFNVCYRLEEGLSII